MNRASNASPHANERTSQSSSQPPPPTPLDAGLDGHVCPFCGLIRETTDEIDASAPCPRCTLADTPTTRNATKARIGPWHVRQMRNPWAPGMRWDTLLALLKRGQVTRDSIVRGPTTHQLWKRASEVKGLSREFGVCYSCGGDIDTQASLCPHCNRLQEPPAEPNTLIETREPARGGGGSSGNDATAAAKASDRPNGNPSRRRGDDDIDELPHMDIGGAAARSAAVTDPDDMLGVDDSERVAELARSVTSRAPQTQRGNRPQNPAAPKPQAAMPPQQKKQQPPPPSSPPPSQEDEPAMRPVPLRPRQPGADDALLTPQELAAAFQLDFTPAGASSKSSRSSRPSHDSAGRPRRKRSKWFIAFVLLVLMGIGAAALGYLRPDLREQAETWSQATYAKAKEFMASRTAPPAQTPSAAPAATPTSTFASSPPTRPNKRAVGEGTLAQSPTATPAPAPVAAATPAPTTRPAPVMQPPSPAPVTPRVEPQIAIAPAPPPRTRTIVVEPTQAPIPASAKSASAPEPVEIIRIDPPATATAVKPANTAKATPAAPTTQKVWTNLSEAEDEARRLWRLAIDAEQNQDFVEAVSLYEQIKKLPPSVHPAGLEVRLSLARKLTK